MLRLQNLTKSFASHFEPILKGVTLTLEKGDFCVLIGSNGSGKSTLLKCISGEYAIDSGDIYLDADKITHAPIHRRAHAISSVSQDVTKGTITEMTLLENLSLSDIRGKKAQFSTYKRHANALKEKIASLKLGLEHYCDTPLGCLSGGQRQMIATVMATLSAPQLLLLDEHCSALDPTTQGKVMAFTANEIAKQQLSALMITHNLNDAIAYGNRLIMLNQGNIVLDLKGPQKQAITVSQLLALFHKDPFLVEQGEALPC